MYQTYRRVLSTRIGKINVLINIKMVEKNKNCRKCEKQYNYTVIPKAQALVLMCIDYRFVDTAVHYLENELDLENEYDLTALAGASLAYNQNKFKSWPITFIDHINIAIELHNIKRIIVFDHMDCGMYHLIYPKVEPDSEEERELHIMNINKFIRRIKRLYPKLAYSGYLLNIDGSVDLIE